MAEVASEDCLWRGLCITGQHGHCLDFKESLGCFRHPDARPLPSAMGDDVPVPEAPSRQRSSASSAGGTPWKDVYRRSTDSLRYTVCVDVGRGYAKYGTAAGRPATIQICQPNAEASAETVYAAAFQRLHLRRTDLPKYAMIVAEVRG